MVRRGGEKQGGKRERCLQVGWMWECAILNRVIGKDPLRRIPGRTEEPMLWKSAGRMLQSDTDTSVTAKTL